MRSALLVATLAIVSLSTTAHADRRSFGGGSGFVSNGTFGLGLELGEPTGLNGKWFYNPSRALNFGIGALYHNYYVDGDGLHIYADHLWHPVQLTSTADFKLPFYVGVGGRVWFFDYRCGGRCDGASLFGVRVPLGIAFDLNKVPLDIFVQIVPTFDFYRNYRGRDFYLAVDFSVGIRYWF